MPNEAVISKLPVAPVVAPAEADPAPQPRPAFRTVAAERARRWMTALGKLLRTTAFKLSLVYLTFFALFAAVLVGYFAWTTSTLITQQITETISAEINGLTEAYGQGGIRRLVLLVDARSRRPGSNLYLVTTPAGEGLAGNVDALEPGVLEQPGLTETTYRRLDETEDEERHALVRVVRLTGGFRLLVGRDLEERGRLHNIMFTTARWSIAVVVVLGLAAGFFVTRRVLKRIDAMSGTARTIMAGDLSERLPIAGTGDELDRLAESLNAMLERIEALMHGLKEVSDNIAHDLRTPLTRLRNRTEDALRMPRGDAGYRAALETVLEESDGLIRTFNALLMIARAESGEVGDAMTVFDAAEVVHDVAELYEPLAEEKGLTLRAETDGPAPVKGNRELISQALANLLDNAIKYAAPRHLAPALAPATGEGGESAPEERRRAPEVVIGATSGEAQVELFVADAGPGVPVEDRKRVVERFVRLEQSRSEPGAGLGLSLAAAVARLHRGELALADNAPGLRAKLVLPKA
jgi:signal transduction histidine kinase